MSDKKISQLTAATTPLAGTEVLPIVQSSTTVKASIANIQAAPVAAGLANGVQYLNASKAPITTANFTYDGSKLTILDQLLVSTSQTMLGDNGKISGGAADANTALSYFTGKNLYIKESTAIRVTVATGGNVTVNTGNLVIGTAGKGLDFGSSVLWRTGAGTPEGAVTAAVGSLYTRTDGGAGTTLYVKESGAGNTGWVGK